jgi:hypothetical protein
MSSEVWRKRYTYRGVPYEIACVDHKKHFGEAMNKIGRHYVLEYVRDAEVFKRVNEVLHRLRLHDDWLWEDTMHLNQENWNDEEMINWLHERAREDIDFVLDKAERLLSERHDSEMDKLKGVILDVVLYKGDKSER